MADSRVGLYRRLPDVYKPRHDDDTAPQQLEAYLAILENVFDEIGDNIEQLYHDLFIEHCDPWVIPYIADLLGTSHLSGGEVRLRRDVASTIALRRRKGTIGAIETLTYNLTRWGVHAVELREWMSWNHHLNHQRPDRGGEPPYGDEAERRPPSPRGGTALLRDPALITLSGTPFEPFSRTADVRPATPTDSLRVNLPNLAIFLWRLEAYTVPFASANAESVATGATGDDAEHAVRIHVDPLSRPVKFFNTFRYDPDARPLVVAELDATPGPMPAARLNSDSKAGNPDEYIEVFGRDSEVGLRLLLPNDDLGIDPDVDVDSWTFRGGDLCAWETGLNPELKDNEIVVDPVRGRLLIGVNSSAKANAIRDEAEVSYTYGAVGSVGAHPASQPEPPAKFAGQPVTSPVEVPGDAASLEAALGQASLPGSPLVIEITDSEIHDLDLGVVSGTSIEDGGPNLRLGRSLMVRPSGDHRPVIRLQQPLRFRPDTVDDSVSQLRVRLEGLFITRDMTAFPAGEPLIARAALNALEIRSCTLDPGGHLLDDLESRSDFVEPAPGERPVPAFPPSVRLVDNHGFPPGSERDAFDQTPIVDLDQTITGPLRVDTDYSLCLRRSIVDAGSGPDDDPTTAGIAIKGLGAGPTTKYGAPTAVDGVTFIGRVQVRAINGKGGIWTQPLEVENNQTGCLRFSRFAPAGNRLSQHYASTIGGHVRFTSEIFGEPGYGQLSLDTSFTVRERGPDDDAMGAFGYLLEAHNWRNLQIRYREFMPVGVRPLLIPVT